MLGCLSRGQARAVRGRHGHRLELWDGGITAAASTLVLPEVASALTRNLRLGHLDEAGHAAAVDRWRRIADQLVLLRVDTTTATRAAELVEVAALTGAAAVHLASATQLGDRGAAVTVATWDRRLHFAAGGRGIGLVPAVLP